MLRKLGILPTLSPPPWVGGSMLDLPTDLENHFKRTPIHYPTGMQSTRTTHRHTLFLMIQIYRVVLLEVD